MEGRGGRGREVVQKWECGEARMAVTVTAVTTASGRQCPFIGAARNRPLGCPTGRAISEYLLLLFLYNSKCRRHPRPSACIRLHISAGSPQFTHRPHQPHQPQAPTIASHQPPSNSTICHQNPDLLSFASSATRIHQPLTSHNAEPVPTLPPCRSHQALPPRTPTSHLVEPRTQQPGWRNLPLTRLTTRRDRWR